jgi:hypothetical protein
MRENIKVISCILTIALFIGLNIIMQSISFGAGEESNPWAIVALTVLIGFVAGSGIYLSMKSKKNKPMFY